MSKEIKTVFESLHLEMEEFRRQLNSLMNSDFKYVNDILKYLFNKRGKQIRPIFVILSSGICNNINEKTYKAAALIELLHTATLVHDDIVDDADYRRGQFTINALWKNKAAVLLGDYLLAKGLLTALDNNYIELLKLVADATRKMSEGELLQIQTAKKRNITEDTYFKIIEYKTASLFSVCFKGGAFISGADNKTQEIMSQIGLYAGMAFQIKDDIIDLEPQNSEKPSFIDLKEQKITLPVIHALNNSSLIERQRMYLLIKKFKKNKNKSDEIINWLSEKNSIEYTNNVMLDYKSKSI
jgi:octaprenyl-diphosphate synthase